jgi:hypothetical protein
LSGFDDSAAPSGPPPASTGLPTCFWHTIRNIHILHDPSGWLTGFQAYARQPYPEPLATAIIQKNLPLIRGVIPAYLHQIEKAVPRGDRSASITAWLRCWHRILTFCLRSTG